MTSSIRSFPLSNKDVLFFDVFYKNNKIHLILPIYNEPYSTNDIKLLVNSDTYPLVVSKQFIKNGYEPIIVYIYEYFAFSKKIKLTVEYKNIIHKYNLKHIICNDSLKPLGLTTLFKDDYRTFPFFYEYYKKQGVSHFYMYYNGKITNEIREIFTKDKSDVTLIEWNFRYWNFLEEDKEEAIEKGEYLHAHHAQLGQLHHAIYRYGKDVCDYMCFCDFDEYLHIPNSNLLQFIQEYPDIDIIGFRNKWADTPSVEDLKTQTTLITSDPFPYEKRSKNIYKMSSVNTIYIHFCYDYTKSSITGYMDFFMYHFYKWNNNKHDYQNECQNIENIVLV